MTDLELSPSGRARREQILNMAIQQGRQRRRRRLAIRGGTVAIVLLAIGAAVSRMPHSASHRSETSIVEGFPLPPVPAPLRAPAAKVEIERIQTDPTIVQRLAVPKTRPRWQRLDDDHFLQELAHAGKPAGLVEINGQVTLVFHRPLR